MHKIKTLLFLFISVTTLILFPSCGNSDLKEKGSADYIKSVKEWHNKRIENLKKENGWLNLAGLYWLKEGENTFGSGKNNDVIFPEGKAPDRLGVFIRNGENVSVKINPEYSVTTDSQKITEIDLMKDVSGNPTVLHYGSLKWFIIKRAEKIGVRLRDVEAPLVKKFKDIETYPINSDWRFDAEYRKFESPKTISVPNILGQIDEEEAEGEIVFEKEGKEYSLIPIKEGDSFFVIFADQTNGEETYGAGRFLYTDLPDSTGSLVLDFNKAYNPPCVFTKYATCPLPPKQNYLKMEITAGEKMFHGGAHE